MLNFRATVSAGREYAKAEYSRIIAPLDPQIAADRIEVCKSCEFLAPSPELGKVGYCKSCNCPRWSRSEITVKATMPAATCPRNKWVTLKIIPKAREVPPDA